MIDYLNTLEYINRESPCLERIDSTCDEIEKELFKSSPRLEGNEVIIEPSNGNYREDIMLASEKESYYFDFIHSSQYLVVDLGEPKGEKKTVKINSPYRRAFPTGKA
ncbi:hypothetical protein JMM81_12380 [Bacillus sp. V3B]|uniref:hypothetical protein n=1 Tax=Bacillus sp. V3B TaxID=2804915 RepID=UPI00210A5A6F|nr:hypothetical protein [Bacillus sp. V3B]MCQ6275753.1 hypothetical protein [Bacillus sp. V3B]